MNLLIDAAGLHSVGRCLDKVSKGEEDLGNLFQFASQLVFANKIYLCGLQTPGVAKRSKKIIQSLLSQGLNNTVITFIPIDKDAYKNACKSAADRLAEDLNYVYHKSDYELKDIITFARPERSKYEILYENNLHDFIVNKFDESLKQKLLKISLKNIVAGSTAFMLSVSDNLCDSLSKIIQKAKWTKYDTELLLVYLRYYLNEELANYICPLVLDELVEYSPCISRARIVNKQNLYIIKKLSTIVGDAAKKLEPKLLGAPSIAGALALKSKGEPLGVINEAILAREKASELREYIKLSINAQKEDKPDDIDDIRKTIMKIAMSLERDLGITPKPTLGEAFEIQFLGLFPLPNINKLVEWYNFKMVQKKIIILSEFAKVLVNYKLDPFIYEKLKNNVCQEIK